MVLLLMFIVVFGSDSNFEFDLDIDVDVVYEVDAYGFDLGFLMLVVGLILIVV